MPRRGSVKQHSSVNTHVGARLRQLRLMLDLSQTEVGRKLGISYQQVQKYERGVNALAADRLAQIADAFKVPVSYFFEGLGAAGSDRASAAPAFQPGEIRFIREMRRLPPTVRDAVQQLMVSTNGTRADEAARAAPLPTDHEPRPAFGRAKS